MSLLFIDSFGGYTTADLPTRYKGGAYNGPTIQSGVLPPSPQAGAQTLQLGGGSQVLSDTVSPVMSRTIMGCRFYKNSTNNGNLFEMGLSLGVGGQIQPCCALAIYETGTYITDGLLNNGNPNTLATGPVIPQNEWHHIEFDVIYGTAANATLVVYLDGNPTPFMSVAGQTLQRATADRWWVGAANQNANASELNSAVPGYVADLYVFSGTGPVSTFNSALAPQGFGAPKVAFSVPNGVGIISDWTPNGAGTIWQSINQIPQDGDTTYASDATPGDQYQCTFTALPAQQSLLAVQLSNYARTDDAGPRAYQSGFWKGGTFGYSGVNQFLAGTYNYIEDEFMVNPVTGVAWIPGDLVGLQYGARLTI
jgi:hypothetical protein